MSATLSGATPPITTCQGDPPPCAASATLRQKSEGGWRPIRVELERWRRPPRRISSLSTHISAFTTHLNLVQIWSEAVSLSSTSFLSNSHLTFLSPSNQPQSEAVCVYIVINHHPLSDFHCDSDPSFKYLVVISKIPRTVSPNPTSSKR